MLKTNYLLKSLIYFTKAIIVLGTLFFLTSSMKAQTVDKKPVLWEPVDVKKQDLFWGPGGKAMQPDLSKVTYIEERKGGSSKKFEIKDAKGDTWVAKIDTESQAETAAVRFVSALGFKTEIVYLTPTLTIPGKGTFKNVRLEARPKNVDRGDRWEWRDNPFSGTKQLKGLKVMMAFLNNWDLKDGNTIILNTGNEAQYVISDLGATFGKYGSNSFPIIWRLGRSKNNPEDYSKSKFIREVESNGEIDFAFKGKDDEIFENITINEARWVTDLLLQLSDKQIRDAFRAANYTQSEINLLTNAVKNRILELDRATQPALARK